jgi:DNA repair exonuclease SbcCD ATPase subunit
VLDLLSARKEQEVPATAPVIEMSVLAPELEITLPSAPPIPAPAPVVMAAPAAPAAMPALQLAGEVRTLHETIQRLEGRVAEQGKSLVHLEQQLQAFRESATQAFKEVEQKVQTFRDNADRAVTQVQGMEARLAEEEKQSAELRTRLADLEPAAASAKQLLQMLVEFSRHALKPGESGER